ncbi:DNA-directed DNA polymerase [Quillaja saponaria]|uniref:DNA-directed DNA polymerase n=1 Tax=Quillaja saponaria TaxID=32244 RepID=A0AAD7PCJ2_QUISA|nr:DNA-directed DNA polymerase [Quillaja saponaria]
MRPTMQNDPVEQANAIGGVFPGQPQRKYDSYSNTYNPGWRDHSNLRYGNQPQPPPNGGRNINPPGFQAQPQYQSRQPYNQ